MLDAFQAVRETDSCWDDAHIGPRMTARARAGAVTETTVEGQVITPFTLHASLPNAAPSAETGEQVRTRSRIKYGRPRITVEQAIEKSLRMPTESSPEEEEILQNTHTAAEP